MTNKKMWSIRVRTGKRFPVWMIFIALVLICYGGYKVCKELTRSSPQPLVFLIRDDYFGPVFFFFGQPDGVDVKPDPLGQAIVVPENGVVKLKARSRELVPTISDSHRLIYMVSISKSERRKNLIMFLGTVRNDNGQMVDTFLDENSKYHEFPNVAPKYYYLTDSQRNKQAIYEYGGCADQKFYPPNDPNGKPPGCGKFLVMSPNEFIKHPKWMWDYMQHDYSSIKEFEADANELVIRKKDYYKLP